jgi:hypothetical protein
MRESLKLQPEEELILLAADIQPDQSTLNRMDVLIPAVCNWEVFTKTAIDRATAPLFVHNLSKLVNAGLVPSPVLRSLKQASLRTLTRNMLLTEHFRQIVQRFTEMEISVIALKGILLMEWLYGNINLRQSSDLDLLVQPEKAQTALAVLEEMGYQASGFKLSDFVKENTSIVHFTPMIKNGVSVEIHIRVHSEAEPFHLDMQRMWANALPIQLHGTTALGFSPEDMLLHLCIHLDKHFRSGQFQFTGLYDVVNMLNHKGDVLNWEQFEQHCLQDDAVEATYKYLILVQKYMNGKLPAVVSEKYAHLLKPKSERIFLSVLRGRSIKTNTSGVFRSLGRLENFGQRFRYLFDFFVPSAEFMMKRYRLKSKRQLWWYYPYRLLTGFRALWQNIQKALK